MFDKDEFEDIDPRYPKFFAITSETYPTDLFCFYECPEDKWSERIKNDFKCEVTEIDDPYKPLSIPVTNKTKFLAVAMGDGNGRFNQLMRLQGPVGNLCCYARHHVIVMPCGDYIIVGPDYFFYQHCFPPEAFELDGFPYWEKSPMRNISDQFNLS